MRDRHHQKTTLARSIKNPCPIKTARGGIIYQPPSRGNGDVEQWNYKDLPHDHPERLRIERMFEKMKPLQKKPVSTRWRTER